MNPDLFITIAFCFYAALVATGAGAVVLVIVSRQRRTDASPDLPTSAVRARSSATGGDVFAALEATGVRVGSGGAEPTTDHVATWGAKATIALIGVLLLAAALVAAFLLHPPVLGWIGFAVVCAIVFGLATVATIASSRMRVNPQRPAVAPDGEPRLLVVADEHCGSPALWQEIYAHLAGAVAVHLVVPVRVSHLHYLTNDEAEEFCDAEDRVRLAVGLLRQRGVLVTGGVGSDDPLESMTDALGSFPATRVLLATSTEQHSYWMEHELLAKARAITPLEVSHVVVPPTPSGANRQEVACS